MLKVNHVESEKSHQYTKFQTVWLENNTVQKLVSETEQMQKRIRKQTNRVTTTLNNILCIISFDITLSSNASGVGFAFNPSGVDKIKTS